MVCITIRNTTNYSKNDGLLELFPYPVISFIHSKTIGYFTVVYLVAKPLIWSEAEGDLVEIETSI